MVSDPYNKLYCILLTLYSCTKQAEARAIHHRLSSFVSPCVNGFLLIAAGLSFVFGPIIGLFETEGPSPMHMFAAKWFTIGEIAYCFTLGYLIRSNSSQFDQSAQPAIGMLTTGLVVVLMNGVLMALGPEYLGIHAINAIGEWVGFYGAYFLHFQLSRIIRYNDVCVPQQ